MRMSQVMCLRAESRAQPQRSEATVSARTVSLWSDADAAMQPAPLHSARSLLLSALSGPSDHGDGLLEREGWPILARLLDHHDMADEGALHWNRGNDVAGHG